MTVHDAWLTLPVFGRAYLDEASPSPAGSFQIYRCASLEEVWTIVKSDPYWKEGVWDKEKAVVRAFAEAPGDDSLRIVTA